MRPILTKMHTKMDMNMPAIARLLIFLTVSSILHFGHGCKSGFVQCDDGQCIPDKYSNLCQIAGTGLPPLEVTTQTMIVKTGTTDKIITNPVPKGATSDETKLASTPLGTKPVLSTETQTHVSMTGSTGKLVTKPMTPIVTSGVSKLESTPLVTATVGTTETQTKIPQTGSTGKLVTQPITSKVSPGVTKTTTTNMPLVTDSTMMTSPVMSSVPPVNTCHVGYAKCNDGRCEPYASLCGDTGYVTTKAPATESTSIGTKLTSMGIGPTDMGTMSVKPGSMSTVGSTTVTTATTSQPIIVTDSNGNEVCPSGWEKCKDGVCEPFHWLCTEHDGTVVTTPVPLTTSTLLTITASAATSGATLTGATPVSASNTSTFIPATGPTTGAATSSGGSCPSGWELCADGVCEPFHWLCSEHDGTNITITTPVTVPVTPLPSGASPDSSAAPMSTVSTTTERATTTTTTVGSTVVVSTDSSGTCPVGWTQCSTKEWLVREEKEKRKK